MGCTEKPIRVERVVEGRQGTTKRDRRGTAHWGLPTLPNVFGAKKRRTAAEWQTQEVDTYLHCPNRTKRRLQPGKADAGHNSNNAFEYRTLFSCRGGP